MLEDEAIQSMCQFDRENFIGAFRTLWHALAHPDLHAFGQVILESGARIDSEESLTQGYALDSVLADIDHHVARGRLRKRCTTHTCHLPGLSPTLLQLLPSHY